MNCMILFLMPASTLDLGVGKKVVVLQTKTEGKDGLKYMYILQVTNWLTFSLSCSNVNLTVSNL